MSRLAAGLARPSRRRSRSAAISDRKLPGGGRRYKNKISEADSNNARALPAAIEVRKNLTKFKSATRPSANLAPPVPPRADPSASTSQLNQPTGTFDQPDEQHGYRPVT
jgi:hypothetical protein